MKRGILLLLGAVLLVAGRAAADDASVQEDMKFIEELRKQGKSDLALEYLQRLQKVASPELAKALPLQLARTKLESAGEEPDSAKRLALYSEAREEFQKWLQANPTDPHAGEVKLDLAHVTVQQGKTQLSRAFLNEDFETKVVPEAIQARAIFEDAAAQLKEAAKDLKDKARYPADLDIALNVFDQCQTYPLLADPTGDVSKTRNGLYAEAQKQFKALGSKDDTNPICWKAKAWEGRCMHMLGDFPNAKNRYQQIFVADKKYADEAQRLTRYFYILLLDELAAELRAKDEDDAGIVKRARDWVSENSTRLKTPEGYGVRFLLGKKLEDMARVEKEPGKKADELAEARKWYRQVEESENDFTDRARRNKIEIIATQQGGFKEPIEQLKTFEDCYVRAQFEMMQAAKGEKDAKTPEDAEKVRKEKGALITSALERGLKLADESKAGHGDEALELANAKAMMAYQYMNSQKFREAIAVGEKFAKSDPRSSQASAAAVYVLQSYAEMVSKEAAAEKPPAELPADRKSLLDFAQYMEKTWPKEAAGDMARYQLALIYINARTDSDDLDAAKAARTDNVHKAIEALARITPSYGQYTVTQYQLATFCFGADKEKLAPLAGDGEDGYRKRALAALRSIPPLAAGSDPTTNKVYFIAKAKLAQEDFADKNFDEMELLTQTLLPRLPGATLDADDAKNKAMHEEFEASIKGFQMYAHWAKADGEAKAADKADAKDKPAHYAKILELLDPIVDDIVAGKHPELQKNPPLAHGVLDNALRATIQLNKLDRTQVVLNGYKALATGDAADAGAAEVLKELVAFIPPQLDELKHKGDAAALEAAKKKFGDILTDTLKPLTGDKLTPDLISYTARLYSSMERHKDAAELLQKVAEPASDAPDADKKKYQTIQLQLVRERRLNGEVPEARKLMEEILGDAKKPGWGRKEIPALMENIEVTAAEGDNKSAAELANGLAQKLLPNIETNPRLKEVYLQCDYLMVENAYRQAVKLKSKNPAKFTDGVKAAANMTVELARKQLGFVSDSVRTRFRDLMDASDAEPELKADFLDGYLGAAEAMEKQAEAVQVTNEQRDRPVRDRAFSDTASLIVDLERMWPDYGSDAAKTRATALLGNAELKTAYDKLKAAP